MMLDAGDFADALGVFELAEEAFAVADTALTENLDNVPILRFGRGVSQFQASQKLRRNRGGDRRGRGEVASVSRGVRARAAQTSNDSAPCTAGARPSSGTCGSSCWRACRPPGEI